MHFILYYLFYAELCRIKILCEFEISLENYIKKLK
jgi:hypothetical protein